MSAHGERQRQGRLGEPLPGGPVATSGSRAVLWPAAAAGRSCGQQRAEKNPAAFPQPGLRVYRVTGLAIRIKGIIRQSVAVALNLFKHVARVSA